MAISDWPTGERPRERLLALGASALSDAELLAIYLRVGVRGKSAVDLARDLILHFDGNLGDLAEAPLRELASVPGIGTAKAPYIGMELDQATLATMRLIKQALDPNNIMNPGKMFRN